MACLSAAAPAQTTAPEYRAAYVASWDLNTPAKCDQVIANILSGNINAVYIQIRSRGDAFYFPNRSDSTYPNPEPRGQTYALSPSDFDPLQYFIDRLHAASPRREVHAWVTTYNCWNRSSAPPSAAHVYRAHPEWITETKGGITLSYGTEYATGKTVDDSPLDPGIPAVREYLTNVFMDIIRNYDVDGLHFDYIRLIFADSGYDPVAKARFRAETGWNFDTENASGQLDAAYKAWRRDQVARLVQQVTRQTQREKPWVETSAFTVNFTDSIENLAQGYNWWIAYGAIDALHPSAYSSTVSGSQEDWNFSVAKLAQHGDTARRPLICALGDYLLTATGSNAQAVTTLRANARRPDGFNFFDYGSLYLDGASRTPPEAADQHARNLFSTGGPMSAWAPVPARVYKAPLGAESTAPLAPANLAVALSGGVPRITFARPAPAADGDLPIHYRLYRDTQAPVRRYYENLAMEWWDLSAGRAAFAFEDVLAPSGTVYYAAVAYDNWNNEAVAASGGVQVAAAGEYIIETRAGGKNFANYSESGVFTNSSSHSTAPGLTADLGSRFALPGDSNGRADKARFTPTGLAAGTYDVFVTCAAYGSSNAQGITVRVSDAGGVRTSLFNLTAAVCGNQWAQVATMNITPGQGHYIEFDNTTQTNIGTSTDSRMNAAATRFARRVTPQAKEPQPPAPFPLPRSEAAQIIVDSHPLSLDYDDARSAGGWTDATYPGYYNGTTRVYPTANYPVRTYALWVVDLPRPGRWAIDGWVRINEVFGRQAQYRFVDSSGTVRNVTTTQRTGGNDTNNGAWAINVDGVTDANAYHFAAGRVYVTLYGNGAAGTEILIADALRFRLIEPDLEATGFLAR